MKNSIYLALFILLFWSCSDQRKQPAGQEYKTITIKPGNLTLYTDYPAALQGRQFVEIRPQVSGTITDILTDEGAPVKKGQILFIIDQVPYRAALETAEANVRSAEAKLMTARLTTESKEALFKEKVISDFDLQMARNEQLEAEAALALAKAEETNARNNLSYTEVKSPVNGVTSMIPYRIGALVDSNISEPLVTVSDDSYINAYFSMSENQILDIIQQYGSLEAALSEMPEAQLVLSNGTPYGVPGRINAISGTVDNSTGAVGIRAAFSNPDQLLRNGGSGTVRIPVTFRDCIIIPQAATYELQNLIFVWKIVDGKTVSVPIKVHKYNDGSTYIVTSGLSEGDMIIAEGAGLMREGTQVIVKDNPESIK